MVFTQFCANTICQRAEVLVASTTELAKLSSSGVQAITTTHQSAPLTHKQCKQVMTNNWIH